MDKDMICLMVVLFGLASALGGLMVVDSLCKWPLGSKW